MLQYSYSGSAFLDHSIECTGTQILSLHYQTKIVRHSVTGVAFVHLVKYYVVVIIYLDIYLMDGGFVGMFYKKSVLFIDGNSECLSLMASTTMKMA
jgi:hypothetical protein